MTPTDLVAAARRVALPHGPGRARGGVSMATAKEILEVLRVYLPTESGANMYWEYDRKGVEVLAERCAAAEARCAKYRGALEQIREIMPASMEGLVMPSSPESRAHEIARAALADGD